MFYATDLFSVNSLKKLVVVFCKAFCWWQIVFCLNGSKNKIAYLFIFLFSCSRSKVVDQRSTESTWCWFRSPPLSPFLQSFALNNWELGQQQKRRFTIYCHSNQHQALLFLMVEDIKWKYQIHAQGGVRWPVVNFLSPSG